MQWWTLERTFRAHLFREDSGETYCALSIGNMRDWVAWDGEMRRCQACFTRSRRHRGSPG